MMLDDLNPTTRRFPNSLLEAFPTHYPEWLEAPPPKTAEHVVYMWAGIALWVSLAVWFVRYT
jgi:hypothetical protein